jgi:hypothetical protein
MYFLASDEYVVAQILIQINLWEGLEENLELVFGGKTLKHSLDYEGVTL